MPALVITPELDIIPVDLSALAGELLKSGDDSECFPDANLLDHALRLFSRCSEVEEAAALRGLAPLRSRWQGSVVPRKCATTRELP
ncbi:hypothetical protein PV664_36010 [Streptomyces sp. ME01-18a]|uniref:hypothetical protein n=1 Tax=Streptomyces sp. ME01-18a TaxID=3028669 RepID=UPI0029A818F6|nr:hypothetical protein [Streptomyces sp. ME01-18a]MDX3434257.1 hypothetical protein [Streptomyces sp. ME01-18a]